MVGVLATGVALTGVEAAPAVGALVACQLAAVANEEGAPPPIEALAALAVGSVVPSEGFVVAVA